MYCSNCGNMIEDGAKFCPYCGANQNTAAAPAGYTAGRRSANIEKKRKQKKAAVVLAVIALVLTVLSVLFDQAAVLLLVNGGYGSFAGGLLRQIITGALLPVILAILLVVFCNLIDRKTPALTGIPMVISTLIIPVNFILNKRIMILPVLVFIVSVIFLVFYFLSVAGSLRKSSAGKILSIIFACVLGILYLFEMGGFYGSTAIRILSLAGNSFWFLGNILTLASMIAVVTYASTSDAASNAYQGQPYRSSNPQDAPSGGIAALGFFFPLIGLILYLVWKDETPLRAKSAGKGALAGFITGIVLSVLFTIIYIVVIQGIINFYMF